MKKISEFLKSPYFIIAAVILAVFGWSLSFGFLYYDDHVNVFENQPLLGGQVLYFWKNVYEGLYVPLVYTIWSCIYKLFGLNPFAFHFFNFLFHTINTILVFQIATHLKISKKAALIGALLFAVHPLQVESVVWVTSFKDISFSFFSLLSVLIFLAESRSVLLRWGLGTLAASAAILCKPTAAVLPAFILLYFFVVSPGTIKEKLKQVLQITGPLPFALLIGFYSVQMAKAGQGWSNHPHASVSWFEKPVVVLDALGFYLVKIFVPSNFYVDYGRYPRHVLDDGLFYLNAIIAIGLLVLVLFRFVKSRSRNFKAEVFAGLFGLFIFLPTSGIVAFGHQKFSTVADRYMYLVLAAVAIVAALAFEKLLSSSKPKLMSRAGIIIVVALGALSFMQSINWKDLKLFTENLYEGNPQNYFANRNFGLFYQLNGEDDKALEFFKKADEIDPSLLSAKAAIVSLYFNRREYDKMDSYIKENLTQEKLVTLQQTGFETHAFFMAVAESYIDRKNYAKAMEYLCRARSLRVLPLAQEVADKIQAVKKLETDHGIQCVD